MDFLFDNPLGNMPGVIFLVFYSLFIVFTLIIFRIWKTQADKTALLPVPPIPANIDPYEIAYLRGGANEVARAVIFALRQKDFLIFQTDGKNSRIHRNQFQPDARGLNQMEQAALGWFKDSREPKEIFDGYGLLQVLDPYYEIYEARLEQQQFLTDDATRSRIKRARNIVLLLVLGLGAYKFLAAVTAGFTNVFGIIIIAIIATLITFAAGRVSRLTALGRTYLERLRIAFEKLRYETERRTIQPANAAGAQFAGVDPLLLGVGVFGGAILAGTVYDDYNQAFQRAQHQSGGTGGCGSAGCGSSCSSSSSGGDSGGGSSCGGGGCGGCGGGCS